MRKVALAISILAATGLAALAAMPAAAATTVSVSMTLTEPLRSGWPGSEPCPDIGLDVNCGNGEVIRVRACHPDRLDRCLRGDMQHPADRSGGRVDRAQGDRQRLLMPGCVRDRVAAWSTVSRDPRRCRCRWNRHLSGASGSLSGTLRAAAWHAQIKYAGRLTLAS